MQFFSPQTFNFDRGAREHACLLVVSDYPNSRSVTHTRKTLSVAGAMLAVTVKGTERKGMKRIGDVGLLEASL